MVPRNSVPNSSLPHSSTSLIFSPQTRPVPPCIFHALLLFSSYSLPGVALPHGHIICASTCSSSRLLVYGTSSFLLAGPGPLHEIAVSGFSGNPLGRANTVSLISLHLTPRISLRVSPNSPCFLSVSLSLVSDVRSFGSVLGLPNSSADIISCEFPSVPFRTFSTALSHLLPARAFVAFSHTAPSIVAGNLFFGTFLEFLSCIAFFSTFSCLYLIAVGIFPVLPLLLSYY